MDWERYKALCDAPEIFSRWLIEQTLELLDDPALVARLRSSMNAAPLSKPPDHHGGPATDMFRMLLTLPEATAIRRRIERASAAEMTTSATRDRGLGGFVEAWQEYEQWLIATGSGPAACSARS